MASVLKLLDRQLELWELKRRMRESGARPGRHIINGVDYGPCLLISRECGSGGRHVAGLAGKRLEWHVFDREILDDIAQLAHVRLELLESVDEQTRAIWEEEDWRPELLPEDIGTDSYLRYLRQVVMALGHHGDVIILGRGAQYLLPAQCSFRVRIVAPLEARVRRVAEAAGIPYTEAEDRVARFDAERAVFVQKSFQRDVHSSLNYDLVINTGEISFEAAAELALTGMQNKLGVPF